MARRSDHTREELTNLALETAEQLLLEKSVSEISARQIAKGMGYTVGTLYTLFTNLDDLFIHILGRFLDQLYQRCQHAIENETTALKRVRSCGKIYLQTALDQQHIWEMLFSNKLQRDQSHAWVEQKIELLFAMLNSLLKELAPNKTDIKIEQGAHMLWGSVHGITVLSLQGRIGSNQAERLQLMDEMICCFVQGWSR